MPVYDGIRVLTGPALEDAQRRAREAIRRWETHGDGWYAAYRREVEAAWEAGRECRELAEWTQHMNIITRPEASEFIVI